MNSLCRSSVTIVAELVLTAAAVCMYASQVVLNDGQVLSLADVQQDMSAVVVEPVAPAELSPAAAAVAKAMASMGEWQQQTWGQCQLNSISRSFPSAVICYSMIIPCPQHHLLLSSTSAACDHMALSSYHLLLV